MFHLDNIGWLEDARNGKNSSHLLQLHCIIWQVYFNLVLMKNKGQSYLTEKKLSTIYIVRHLQK